jgi:hypothetical protein
MAGVTISGNPATFAAGATTLALNHAIRVTGFALLQASATAATAKITDLNGNLLLPELAVQASIGAYAAIAAPLSKMIPGGPNALNTVAQPSTVTVNAATVSVAGAGAVAILTYD